MPRFRRDIDERLEDKTPLVQAWVGDSKAGFIDYEVPHQQDININFARPLSLQAEPTHFRFDGENCFQQFARSFFGFDVRHTVQEPGLIGEIYGLRFV